MIAFSPTGSVSTLASASATSGDSKVETISRLAQWRIESFGPCLYRRSDSFKLGIWNWFLSIEKNRYMYIRLFPEPNQAAKDHPPIVKFVLRVLSSAPGRRPYISPVHERLLRSSEDFVWPVDCTVHGCFVIDVEFLDLKMSSVNGGEACSIWTNEGTHHSHAGKSTLQRLSRMLEDGIYADVTINTSGGTLRAHKAILSASSPVFESMFLNDLEEKKSSAIDMDDMTLDGCSALLGYIYGSIEQDDFWRHRLALLGAANKYGIADLKACCEESLLEDIGSSNVLERLQEAWLCGLPKLKKGCLRYLFDFGKIYDVREDIDSFFRRTDRGLMLEMFQEVLTVWQPA